MKIYPEVQQGRDAAQTIVGAGVARPPPARKSLDNPMQRRGLDQLLGIECVVLGF